MFCLLHGRQAVFPDVVVAPGVMVGATDSRHYTHLSDNVYRFCPTWLLKTDIPRFHVRTPVKLLLLLRLLLLAAPTGDCCRGNACSLSFACLIRGLVGGGGSNPRFRASSGHVSPCSGYNIIIRWDHTPLASP